MTKTCIRCGQEIEYTGSGWATYNANIQRYVTVCRPRTAVTHWPSVTTEDGAP